MFILSALQEIAKRFFSQEDDDFFANEYANYSSACNISTDVDIWKAPENTGTIDNVKQEFYNDFNIIADKSEELFSTIKGKDSFNIIANKGKEFEEEIVSKIKGAIADTQEPEKEKEVANFVPKDDTETQFLDSFALSNRINNLEILHHNLENRLFYIEQDIHDFAASFLHLAHDNAITTQDHAEAAVTHEDDPWS